ncbi:MAG: thermonuclease family protein [Alphaproteobacteria bacterium]|nr:thermonuclease family protein [Alphaproteobacteria bacterium]
MVRGILAVLLLAVATAAQAEIAGRASVIDGDTIEIQGQRIRLHGIDAPESGQLCQSSEGSWRCGQQAAMMLQNRIGARPVTCREKARDRHGRVVAACRVDGIDLGAWAVSEGWALAYRHFSQEYLSQEAAAREARRGIWRGRFAAPWDWREGRRRAVDHEEVAAGDATPAPSVKLSARESSDCRIKGNISSSGERIYHVPGGEYYQATVVNEPAGERWFCSEAEARAAGWRRSKR